MSAATTEEPRLRLPMRKGLPIEAARERVAALRAALDDGTAVFGPTPEPCVCGAPRWDHEGVNRTGKCKDSGCHRYRRELVDLLVAKALDGERRTIAEDLRTVDRDRRAKRSKRPHKGLRVRPSDAGECRRKVWYRNTPPDDLVLAPSNRMAALMGTIVHEGVQEARKARYEWRLFEQTIPIDGLDSEGRIDEYDPILTLLRDTKTASEGVWRMLNDDGPPEGKWKALLIYALMMNRLGYPVTDLALDYVRRSDGKAETHYRRYDEPAALAALDELLDVLTALENGEELPRDRTGPSNDPICANCEYRLHCWNVPQAEAAGRSPESWTNLGPEPDAADVDAVLGTYAEARAAESAAKDAKSIAKGDLAGIDPGEYGDYRLGWKQQWKEDPQAFADLLIEQLSLDPEERTPISELRPPKRRIEYVDVRKVRKAKRDERDREMGAA